MAGTDGALEAAPLYEAAAAAGFSDTKLRLAIRRLVDGGLLTQSGRGRSATLQLTEEGLAEQAPDLWWTAAAYRRDAGLDPWDGAFHFVAFEIPESERAARDALRSQIQDMVGAAVAGGLYVSPHGWEPWLAALARAHGVGHRVWFFESTQLLRSDGEVVAAADLWPTAALADAYAVFVDRWSPLADHPPSDPSSAVRHAFEASAMIEQLLRRDPLLPDELVGRDRTGSEARRVYRTLMRRLAEHEPQIVLVDESTGSWGHLNVDEIWQWQ